MQHVLLIIFGVLVLGLFGWLTERKWMAGYWHRACTGVHWRRRFPQASKADIRTFLGIFVDAFGFNRSRQLCFSPDDRVMDVYRTVHPPKWAVPDAFELEALVLSFDRNYGINLVPLWHENMTLGELFSLTPHVRKASGS
ncbi:MAG: hypothetical protein WCL04_03080 [Verrucomicrobiota bacterium]